MATPAHTTRDRGFALVGRLNRWLIAGAIALSGGLSVAAANAFHGRTRGQRAAAAVSHNSSSSTGPSSNSSGRASNSGGGLQAPAQAPSSSPAAPSGGVVSGGS